MTPTGMPQGGWYNLTSLLQLWTGQNLVVNRAQVNFLEQYPDPALGKGNHQRLPETHNTTQSIWARAGGSDGIPPNPSTPQQTLTPDHSTSRSSVTAATTKHATIHPLHQG